MNKTLNRIEFDFGINCFLNFLPQADVNYDFLTTLSLEGFEIVHSTA